MDEYMTSKLSIIVLGASGDLAKKKTYPSLFDLYSHGYLPENVVIMGFARSSLTNENFRSHLVPYLGNSGGEKLNMFLSRCFYYSGLYDSTQSFSSLEPVLTKLENENLTALSNTNRLFYFAVPPNVFISAASAIKSSILSTSGWNRLIVEKPFGHDYDSAMTMTSALGALFSEDQIYRIDHYLGIHRMEI